MCVWLAADFAAPLVLPGSSSGPGSTPTESLSEEHLATIVSMGFSRDQASRALRATVISLLIILHLQTCGPLLKHSVSFNFSRINGISSAKQQPKVPTEAANGNIDTVQKRQNNKKVN